MIMYRIEKSEYSNPEIVEVEVDRQTESSVWIYNKRRQCSRYARYSSYFNYYETYREAYDQLEQWAVDHIDRLQKSLSRGQARLDSIRKLNVL